MQMAAATSCAEACVRSGRVDVDQLPTDLTANLFVQQPTLAHSARTDEGEQPVARLPPPPEPFRSSSRPMVSGRRHRDRGGDPAVLGSSGRHE